MEEVIFDHLHAAAYQGTSFGRTILGPEENIKSINRDHLVSYVKQFYTAPRMVIVAAGGVKHDEILKFAEKSMSGISSKNNVVEDPRFEFTGSEVRIRNDDMPLAHVAIGVEGVGNLHPDFFVMMLINSLLGNWDRNSGGGNNLASRLCEIVATEGLVDSLNSYFISYQKTSLFGNYIVTPPDKIADAVYECLNEWQRIANQVSAKEVERGKNKLRSSLLMNLDGFNNIIDDIARQLLTIGRRMTPAEIYLRVNDITVADVKRVATTYLSDVSPVVAAIGPIATLPDYNQIRGWTYWNRI